MQRILFLVLISFMGSESFAQYFQFSQFNFAPQRLNPATVASSPYAEAAFLYRHQSTDGGISLNTNILNASYPLVNSSGKPWSGVGLSFMQDNAGPSGIYASREIGLSYAVNIPISIGHTLSLGFKGLHANRKISIDGFHTGLQFVPERGFDSGLSMGEDFSALNRSFFTLSSGVFWKQVDKKGNQLAYGGVSFFDYNKPDESFIGEDNPYPSTIVSVISIRLYKKDKISLSPEMLFTHNDGKNKFNGGFVTSYELKTYRKKPSDHVDLLTKYLSGKAAMVGIQFWREQFAFGLSYDFSLSSTNVANTGAVECGLIWKNLVSPSKKQKRKRKNTSRSEVQTMNVKKIGSKPLQQDTTSTTGKLPTSSITMSERLKAKQDSVMTNAQAGGIEHEALILEKADLHFNFGFNSTLLDDEAREFLDEVAEALIDNEDLKIQLTGHTDNIGSQKFNLKLSRVRAEAIMNYLIEKGVEEERIESFGKGMNEPLNGNLTEEERAKNRRVEMKIVYDF